MRNKKYDNGWNRSEIVGFLTREKPDLEGLKVFANDKRPHVRKLVAMSANATANIYAQLSKDKDLSVLTTLAENTSPNIPVECFRALAATGHRAVISRIDSNGAAPSEVLRELFVDYSYCVSGVKTLLLRSIYKNFNEFEELYNVLKNVSAKKRRLVADWVSHNSGFYSYQFSSWDEDPKVLTTKIEAEYAFSYYRKILKFTTGQESEGLPYEWVVKLVEENINNPVF